MDTTDSHTSKVLDLVKKLVDCASNESSPDKPTFSKPTTLIKQFDEEEMIALEPLYISAGKADSDGEGITEEELRKLVHNFNKNIDNIQGNIHHQVMTEAFHPLQAFIAPTDMFLGDPTMPDDLVVIPKGQPVVEIQFSSSELGQDLWEKRKSGEVRGVSIGARARSIPNPDYTGEDTP